ncbi:MAG: hypothetical protein AAFY55_16420, partial [Bacteroidota bacterium]
HIGPDRAQALRELPRRGCERARRGRMIAQMDPTDTAAHRLDRRVGVGGLRESVGDQRQTWEVGAGLALLSPCGFTLVLHYHAVSTAMRPSSGLDACA